MRALNYFSDPLPILQRLSSRFLLLQDTLLYDGEHRQMWGGGPLPPWQMWTFPIAVAAACLVCLALRGNKDTHCAEAARFSALMLIFIGAYLFFSRLQIAEHHLIILVPFAAVVTVLAFSMLQNKGRALSAVFALIYIGSAAYWNIAAVRGLKRTGGKGMWSDGIVQLARQIGTKFPGRNIKVLDWGLQANLYVLLNGRLKSEALFSLDTPEKSSRGRPWADEIRKGGVFLLNGPKDREFPAPSEAFLKALETAPPVMHRYSAMQQDGSVYAELIEVEPNTAQHRTTLK